MDTLKTYMGGDSSNSNEDKSRDSEQKSGGGDDGGFMGKLNSMAGGGAQGEKNEDALDKGT